MSFADLATETLAAQGGQFVDPPMLMRASVPLELSGAVERMGAATRSDSPGGER